LFRIRGQSSRPFINAVVGRTRFVRPAEFVSVQIVAQPDSLERALGTVLGEVERVAQHGFPAATLERQKAVLLRRLTSQAASETARSSAAYVSEYTQHYLAGEGNLLSAAQELELAREIFPTITPRVMAEAARFWRERKGLRVLVSVPQFALGFRPPTETSVLALFDSVAKVSLAPDSASAAIGDAPLLKRPPVPGKVVKETQHAKAGVVEWTLSNGARVLFKQSENDPDELLIRAWSAGGFSLVPDSLFFTSGRMVGYMMTEAAGLGDQNRDDLIAQLATTGVRPLKVSIGYADESIELGGSPKELETIFQLLHLQFTAPKLDSAALVTWANVAKYQGRSANIQDVFTQILARGNARLAPIQTRTAELARLDEALAVYRDRFGNAGDFTFMLVGAATADQVKPLVERYIASLPATNVRETPKDPEVRPFVNRVREQANVMPMAKSQTLLVFDGSFPATLAEYLKERERLSMLMLVLERRLRDRLREQLGGTYGVSTFGGTYRLYNEQFRVSITFQSAPERMEELNREMLAIIDSVRASGATAPELARLATVQRRQLETQLQSNVYWLSRMGLFDRLKLPLDRIVEPFTQSSVTPAELSVAAQRYLPKDIYIHVTQMPADTAWRGKQVTAGRVH
jgi:zinc protease